MANSVNVGKANVSSISHDAKETLTVIFNGGRTYEYKPVSVGHFNLMSKAAGEEDSTNFKGLLNQVKTSAEYKEIK